MSSAPSRSRAVCLDHAGPQDPIVAAHHVCRFHRREFGQGEREDCRIPRLRPKTVEGGLPDRFAAVAVEHLAREVEVGPHLPQLLIRHAQPLAEHRVEHLRFVIELIEQAAADVGDHGAQIDQMVQRSPGGHQRHRMPAVGVSDQHDIVAAISDGRAHHVGVGVEAGGAVLAGQVHRHHVMAGLVKERRQLLPTPSAVPGTMHQGKRCHRVRLNRFHPARTRSSLIGHGIPEAGRARRRLRRVE